MIISTQKINFFFLNYLVLASYEPTVVSLAHLKVPWPPISPIPTTMVEFIESTSCHNLINRTSCTKQIRRIQFSYSNSWTWRMGCQPPCSTSHRSKRRYLHPNHQIPWILTKCPNESQHGFWWQMGFYSCKCQAILAKIWYIYLRLELFIYCAIIFVCLIQLLSYML